MLMKVFKSLTFCLCLAIVSSSSFYSGISLSIYETGDTLQSSSHLGEYYLSTTGNNFYGGFYFNVYNGGLYDYFGYSANIGGDDNSIEFDFITQDVFALTTINGSIFLSYGSQDYFYLCDDENVGLTVLSTTDDSCELVHVIVSGVPEPETSSSYSYQGSTSSGSASTTSSYVSASETDTSSTIDYSVCPTSTSNDTDIYLPSSIQAFYLQVSANGHYAYSLTGYGIQKRIAKRDVGQVASFDVDLTSDTLTYGYVNDLPSDGDVDIWLDFTAPQNYQYSGFGYYQDDSNQFLLTYTGNDIFFLCESDGSLAIELDNIGNCQETYLIMVGGTLGDEIDVGNIGSSLCAAVPSSSYTPSSSLTPSISSSALASSTDSCPTTDPIYYIPSSVTDFNLQISQNDEYAYANLVETVARKRNHLEKKSPSTPIVTFNLELSTGDLIYVSQGSVPGDASGYLSFTYNNGETNTGYGYIKDDSDQLLLTYSGSDKFYLCDSGTTIELQDDGSCLSTNLILVGGTYGDDVYVGPDVVCSSSLSSLGSTPYSSTYSEPTYSSYSSQVYSSSEFSSSEFSSSEYSSSEYSSSEYSSSEYSSSEYSSAYSSSVYSSENFSSDHSSSASSSSSYSTVYSSSLDSSSSPEGSDSFYSSILTSSSFISYSESTSSESASSTLSSSSSPSISLSSTHSASESFGSISPSVSSSETSSSEYSEYPTSYSSSSYSTFSITSEYQSSSVLISSSYATSSSYYYYANSTTSSSSTSLESSTVGSSTSLSSTSLYSTSTTTNSFGQSSTSSDFSGETESTISEQYSLSSSTSSSSTSSSLSQPSENNPSSLYSSTSSSSTGNPLSSFNPTSSAPSTSEPESESESPSLTTFTFQITAVANPPNTFREYLTLNNHSIILEEIDGPLFELTLPGGYITINGLFIHAVESSGLYLSETPFDGWSIVGDPILSLEGYGTEFYICPSQSPPLQLSSIASDCVIGELHVLEAPVSTSITPSTPTSNGHTSTSLTGTSSGSSLSTITTQILSGSGSTITTTFTSDEIVTITECPATVTNCPLNSIKTITIPHTITTTYCPASSIITQSTVTSTYTSLVTEVVGTVTTEVVRTFTTTFCPESGFVQPVVYISTSLATSVNGKGTVTETHVVTETIGNLVPSFYTSYEAVEVTLQNEGSNSVTTVTVPHIIATTSFESLTKSAGTGHSFVESSEVEVQVGSTSTTSGIVVTSIPNAANNILRSLSYVVLSFIVVFA
ncbi:uncharacterized protein RJT21DRAFT_123060 [Scheffersomyces amazonensis]|uniref:uncharacterized protein n=1 Tax=Scheffersomyces amazonensis TaxID=1078765 RepID=UPI00315CE6FA